MSALPRAARLYLIAMWSITTIVLGIVVFLSPNLLDQIPLLGLGLVIFVFADYYEIEFEAGDGNQALMTVTDAVVIYLVAVVGHAGIFVVALGTFIVSRIRHTAWFRNLFNISSRALTYVALFLLYDAIQLPGALPFSGFRGLVEFVSLGSIDYVASVLFVSTVIALARQQPLLHIYRESFRQVSWVYLVTLPVGAVLAFLWRVDPWISVLGVIPLVMAHRSYKALAAWQIESRRNKALAQESRQLAGKLERLQDTTTAMIASLDPLPLLETVSSRLAALMDASASWVVLLETPTPRMVALNNIAADFAWDAKAYLMQLRQRAVCQLGPTEIAQLHGCKEHAWQSLVIIPLLLEQQVLGGICLASEHPIVLAEDDCRVLAAFAGQAALAMERARLFAELRDKQAELVRSSKLAALGTFSAGIAHEFNNLLAGILGHAELGLMSDDMAEKDDALNVAVRTSMRGKSITRGLLTFARRNDPERDLHQIRDAIEDTLVLVERELVKLNIRVVRRFETVPLTICDLGQVSQVVLNLITNARDAMAQNGGGTITIELYQIGQQIEFAVSDTGCGIAPDLLDQVFQPFVTTKGALGGSTTPGTGLGLAISYGIVESHGGTITIASEVGRGTTMKVRLPIVDELAELAESATNAPQGPMRILIVDDEQMVVEALGRLLAEHGHAVSTAVDGATGLKLYRQQPFDLVITDVIMPGMSGATFVERLRAFDREARVLVITGQPGAPQVDQLLRAGACGVVTKPFVIEELLSAIERGHYARALAA